MGSIVIFKPGDDGRLAAMVAGTEELIEAVKASGMAGEELPMEM